MLFSSCSEPITTDGEGWELVWNDEFDKCGSPDVTKWGFEQGFVRNHEAQWYQPQNVYCEDGILVIEGRKERVENTKYNPESKSWRENRQFAEYTSASVNTKGKFDFQYGRLEVRAKIPTADGAWPAIWTLGQSQRWPSCGEVDVMEYYRVGGEPHILANVAHGNNRNAAIWDSAKVPFKKFLASDPEWESKFHTWRMDWDQESIKLYLDGELLNETLLSKTVNGEAGDFINPFKTPQYILLNLALGGDRGGEIDGDSCPMRYEIDYVRVFQQKKQPHTSFKPAQIWTDTDGVHINAHGGGMLYHDGVYYWYGEHKSEHTSSALTGVRVYSSTDLYNWKNEGIVLPVRPDGSGHKIEKGCIIERPKVIYNEKTKKFVMYFHLELKGMGYVAAEYGVAVSDSPTGEFEFLYAGRSCPKRLPVNMTDEEWAVAQKYANLERGEGWKENVRRGGAFARDFEGGQMARDMTLFVDDDGVAYHIFASEDNQTLHIAELTDDYLHHSGRFARVHPGDANEAPAIFKRNGVYWMITSGCTGWDPNPARLSRATNIFGPWEKLPNPCVGKGSNKTFFSQSTYILLVEGEHDKWIFVADRWRPLNPIDGRYIFLPIEFDEKGMLQINWYDEWKL